MRSLEHQGVKTLFGYPGGSIMPTFDALYGHRDTLDHILVRHEQGATHAAQGFARVSGEVGVCLVTSGPGATNTLTGIADAMIDSTPIVVIAGQVPTGMLGTDAFQGLQYACLVDDILLLALEPLCSSLKSQAFHLHEKVDMLEGLNIFLGEQTVAFCIALRTDEFRELIGPEAYKGGVLPQNFGDFADGI